MSELSAAPVAFGTSGLRGPAVSFTQSNVTAYISGFLEVCCRETTDKTIYIGADLRNSSPRIAAECVAAVQSLGWTAVYGGNVPTPALADFALNRKSPAIMVTGSHIPETYNGIKLYRPDGELMKEDEAPIRAHATPLLDATVSFVAEELPAPNLEIAHTYVQRIVEAYAANSLAGLRIGVDLHSAVGRDLLVEVLEKLGATCFPFRRSDVFIAVDTEAVSDEDIARAQEQISQNQLDAVLSTDGDGDRPLLIDNTGRQINGDVLGAFTAKTLGVDILVTPLSSTSAIEKSNWFKKVVRTRIGSPYVVRAMAHETASANGNPIIAGFEANGGFLLETDIQTENGHLTRLPTRDAFLPLIAVLNLAKQRGVSLSEILEDLPKRFMKADRKKDVAKEVGATFLTDMATSASRRNELDTRLMTPASIDTLDGVRLTFTNDTIVHFRQSGNAPELRCYVETGDLVETENLLREMMRAIDAVLAR